VSELRASIAELRRLPHTLRYLLAYLFYNDGIQTVISMASVLLAQELFVLKGLPVDNAFLLQLALLVQFVALFGSLAFGRLAAIGTKNAILVSLAGWFVAVVYAYFTLQTRLQAFVLAALIAFVLGGSQALSRSLFSRMIPAGREASFFGLYEVSDRGTSWMGPVLFGVVVAATNSYRQAMLSLILLFAAGTVLLVLTDTDRAEREAKGGALPESAALPQAQELTA
jgi:UMF1 family MFS transporter